MAEKKIKRQATYKQMAFETAVRNPERYKGILTAISPYINKVLNDEMLLQVVSSLYLNGIVSSEGVQIDENSTIKNISEAVIKINSTRRADGGFLGYQSRFGLMLELCQKWDLFWHNISNLGSFRNCHQINK